MYLPICPFEPLPVDMNVILTFTIFSESTVQLKKKMLHTNSNVKEFYNNLSEKKRELTVCFILIVFLLSCGCLCFMFLPHHVVGWSLLCNCGIYGHVHFHV